MFTRIRCSFPHPLSIPSQSCFQLFADRDFYDCWWNSTSFDEFARTWNKPVHEFLLRHVYLESIRTYKVSKRNATFLTFFMSSCLHELVMAIVGKKIRFYLFFFQMLQIPLIYISRIPFFKKQRLLGNVIFWLGMLAGLPLIATLYCREVFYHIVFIYLSINAYELQHFKDFKESSDK